MVSEKIEEFFERPPILSHWAQFNNFLWNVETNKFLGRSASSWGKIIFFYLIFYGVLAAFVAVYMWLVMLTLDPKIPKWQLERSSIGTSPGLGYRPMTDSNDDSSLIWFQGSNKTSYTKWVDNLSKFLDKYYVPGKELKSNSRALTCSHHDYPKRDEICKVEVKDWKECNKNNFFNYDKFSPCIFLKLNKIYGWIPEYYDDPKDLPKEMPQKLKDHIRNINNTKERENVWLSCEGENPADVEHLGPMTYYPNNIQGFPGYFFPYLNFEGYLSPLVAVRFEKPVPGVLISVECRAWAKNIIYNRAERMGSVHFELLID